MFGSVVEEEGWIGTGHIEYDWTFQSDCEMGADTDIDPTQFVEADQGDEAVHLSGNLYEVMCAQCLCPAVL